MTRNLGAKSDTWDEIGNAKGLMYQWGRKDPFPSLDGWTDNGNFTVFNEKWSAHLTTSATPSQTLPRSTAA